MPVSSARPDADLREDQLQGGGQFVQVAQQLQATLEAFRESRLVDVDPHVLLRREQELLSAGVVITGALTVILDGSGRIVWISRECEKVTGYLSQELEGTPFGQPPLATNEDDDVQRLLKRVRSSEKVGGYESRWVAKDGRQLRIVWSFATLPDEAKSVDYIVGIGVNIFGWRSSGQANQLEEMRLNSLLEINQKAADLSECDIIQHTLEEVVRLTQSEIGYLHFVNPDQETIHLFTWSEQSLHSCTAAHDSHYPLSKAGVWADCARMRKPVVHNDYQELPGRRGYPEGHSHLERHASIPILDGDNVVIILGVGNKAEDYDDADVRQMLLAADGLWKIILRKRAEEELHQHVRALEEADRQKDEFLAMLAHELRNPLAPISTALQILDQPGVERALVEEAGRVIGRQVKHMTRLVNDLLDVSRITRGKIKIQQEHLDLVEIVHDAMEVNRTFIEVRQHRLHVSLPASHTIVCGDRIRLTQVVSNLLHNAAKYMPDRGQIELTTEQTDEHAIIRVKDAGVGIAPAMLPHVFDLFVQADESLDRSQGGLGLGLTLVRQLVELHGGSVTAFSDGLHQGSEFVVHLPLVRQAPSPIDHAQEPSNSTVSSNGCRILVVDDSEDAASMLATLLNMVGHQVESVHDGKSALAVLASFRPDVVLLDIGLPEMDGYQVAEQIRLSHTSEEILLVALTGYGHEQAIQRGRQAGFDHHLVKPLDLDALCELLIQHRKPEIAEGFEKSPTAR